MSMASMPQIPQPQQPFTLNFDQLFAANKPEGTKTLLEALENERKSRVITLELTDFLPVNPMLAGDVALQLEGLILEVGKVERLSLVLRSTGGMAEIPWRIVTLFRNFCDELEVIVPRSAMSGATHIAIAADSLVMTPLSFLGSVDPTRHHLLLPRDPQGNATPASVQDLKHCIEFVKRSISKEEPFVPVIVQLFSQVHPLAIGAIEQSYELSRLITRKVLATRKTQLPSKQVDMIVEQLAGKYYSHGYPISRNEVESDLQLPVVKADPKSSLFDSIEKLNTFYTATFEKQVAVQAPIPLNFRITGFSETTSSRRLLCQVFGPDGKVVAATWVKEANA